MKKIEYLPQAYKAFLQEHPNGKEIAFNTYKRENPNFEGRYWHLFGKKELLESWEMSGVGEASNYECLKLYVLVQREFSHEDSTLSNVGSIAFSRVAQGFVIGEENGDYIYIDGEDQHSIWIYYHDGGDVEKIAHSFSDFINNKSFE